MRRVATSMGITTALGAMAFGCSHPNPPVLSPNSSSPAVSALVPAIAASLRAGAANLDPAVTGSASITNPNAAGASVSQTFAVGGQAQDGTVASVVVDVAITRNADGSGTEVTRVREQGSGHEFVVATLSLSPPQISDRFGPLSFAGLQLDGTGRVLLLMRVAYFGTFTRTFANVAPSGATLVNLGALPPPAASVSGSFQALFDVLFVCDVTRDGAGQLVARVSEVRDGSNELYRTRSGGPQFSLASHAFGRIEIGGVRFEQRQDVFVPVGPDSLQPDAVPPAAPVVIELTATGGDNGGTALTEIRESIVPELPATGAQSIVHTGALDGQAAIGDGQLQVDRRVRVFTQAFEDPTVGGVLDHSLDDVLGDFLDLEELLYLPVRTELETVFFLVR